MMISMNFNEDFGLALIDTYPPRTVLSGISSRGFAHKTPRLFSRYHGHPLYHAHHLSYLGDYVSILDCQLTACPKISMPGLGFQSLPSPFPIFSEIHLRMHDIFACLERCIGYVNIQRAWRRCEIDRPEHTALARTPFHGEHPRPSLSSSHTYARICSWNWRITSTFFFDRQKLTSTAHESLAEIIFHPANSFNSADCYFLQTPRYPDRPGTLCEEAS